MKLIKALCASFVFLLFFVANFTFAATSNISNLVFSTSPQTLKPNEVSKSITAQTQNSSGTAEQVDETNDTTFTSSSLTGQFLNASGNAVTTTMSKNTSSRTFYYKDSTEGTYTLTVSIKGRDTGKIFSATQQIIISLSASGGNTNTGSGTSTATTTATSTSTTTEPIIPDTNNNLSGSFVYSYSSGTPLSQFSLNDFDLKVFAGRDRVAFVNSPVKFNAQIKTTNLQGNINYSWSFGDGTLSNSKSIEHFYAYPGVYNVVLNVTNGMTDAVSSSKVEVLEPKVSLSFSQGQGGDFVQINNDSNKEMNVAGYRISYGLKSLVIPQDTIVSPNSNIKIPLQISNQDKVSLAYPNGSEISTIISEAEKNSKIALIQTQVDVIKSLIAEINKKENTNQIVEVQNLPEPEIAQTANEEDVRIADAVRDESVKVEDVQSSVSTSTVQITKEENKNFLNTLLSTPKKIFDFIKW